MRSALNFIPCKTAGDVLAYALVREEGLPTFTEGGGRVKSYTVPSLKDPIKHPIPPIPDPITPTAQL